MSDFEDEESIKNLHGILGSFKSKNNPPNSGYCKSCGSYKLIGWGGYGRNVRHMYTNGERIRAKRFGNFFRTIMFYKNFHFYSSGPNKDNNTMHTMGVNSDSMFDYIDLP